MSSDADQTIDRADAEPERFRCPLCQQTFGRVEHLTRHSWSHSKERYLMCSYCHKGFYRGDALRRHEQVHKDPKRSSLGRGVRACLACAKARRKCSGDNPCSACHKRSIDCSYPQSRNARRKSTAETVDRDAMLSSDEQSTELGRGSGLVTSQVTASPQETIGSWSNVSRSPVTVDRDNDGLQGMRRDIPHSAMQPHSHISLSSQASVLNHSSDIPGVRPLSPFLRTSMMDFPQGVNAEPQQTWSSGGSNSLPMKVNTNPELSTTAEANFWSQNGLSSINWLSDDWIPDFDFGAAGLPPQSNYSGATQMQRSQDSSIAVPEVGSAASNFNKNTPPFNSDQGIASPGGSETTQGVGYYYVDGDGARLPRVRKALQQSPHQSSDPYNPLTGVDGSEHSPTQFEFPGTEYKAKTGAAISLGVSLGGSKQIPIEVYSEILHVFGQTCVESSYFSPFQSADFPSVESFALFVHLYVEHFQPILPFIHPATFNLSSSHWLLTLAMAAIGSHYVDIENREVLVVAMHEFLRRAINMVLETGNISRSDGLVFTQIRLLSCIGMMYCGDPRLVERAKASSSDLVGFCGTEWARCIGQDDQTLVSNPSNQTVSDWEAWCHAESHRRTGYSIWLLDCMWAFQFQLRPLLSLEDAKVPVPCQEVLWEADTALDWQQLYSCSTQNPSLHEVIQILYVEKRLQSSMGEFSRILCIHALFRRTWEVEVYFKQPLTLWSPAAEKQDIKSKETSSPVWLPGIQTYARWRNSACDCLDILHWHANSIIGAASGMEHPTVLHLHLARVVLLTPIRHIVQLAELMTEERRGPKSESSDQQEIAQTRTFVRRWATEDQHKARLAMIHSGMVFWHVRRYSVDGFYEPSSVLLATLAMWAYGTFTPNNASGPAAAVGDGPGPSPQANADDDAETLFPTSMQLDRPADDELVQLFVKRGGVMRANVTGVGNLCSAKGPGRVLLEGRKLLVDLKCWRYSRKAVRTLALLSDVCQRGVHTA